MATPQDRWLIRTVVEDLDHIEATWTRDIMDDAIRRDSAVLRRLLAQGSADYTRAWRAAGFKKQPSLVAPDLHAALDAVGLGPSDVKIACLGGAASHGGIVSGTLLLTRKPPPGWSDAIEASERSFKLLQYMRAPSIIVEGEFVSRGDILDYVCHHTGGAHLDMTKHSKTDDLLDSLSASVSSDRPLVYLEVLAFAQQVTRSEDWKQFREEAERVFVGKGRFVKPIH